LGLVALSMPPRPQDILLGPRLFPLMVMGGLMALGAALMFSAWQAGAPPTAPPIENRRGLALVALALLSFVLLVEAAGFVAAEAALFAVTARAFGSRRPMLDAGIGLAVAGTAYVIFKFGLGLSLPAGSLFAAWSSG
jgi:putative tricarboxylic transport membrane protein